MNKNGEIYFGAILFLVAFIWLLYFAGYLVGIDDARNNNVSNRFEKILIFLGDSQ